MTPERLLKLQDYLQSGLKACVHAMDSARESAGMRAIVCPEETEPLRIYQKEYNEALQIKHYIKAVLNSFPELEPQNKQNENSD